MKALLAIGPKLTLASDLKQFSQCLDFIKSDYKITWIDPLENFQDLSFEQYADYWKVKIKSWITTHDVFMGFSLGAILLQDNLDLFLNQSKTIILFSPPSILNNDLKSKLSNALNASLSGKTKEAIQMLNEYVFHSPPKEQNINPLEPLPTIESRLQYGLGYVLNHKIPDNIKRCDTIVYQLVGAASNLVTKDNVFMTPNAKLEIVPNAGNRVLEDNPTFSQAIVKEWLHAKK
jgi:hypothetical protein